MQSWSSVGFVVGSVLEEIAMIPLDRQDPALVMAALAAARLLDDGESSDVWVPACGELAATLAELHRRGDVE